jgi:hypothetical protein
LDVPSSVFAVVATVQGDANFHWSVHVVFCSCLSILSLPKHEQTHPSTSTAGLGEAIFHLAFFLEERGNKGMYPQYFEDTLPKEAVENPEHVPAWENILFQEREGRWFVRKKPHWSLVWGERYGWQTAPGQSLIVQHHDEALATHTEVIAFLDSQKPKRLVETIAGKRAEDLTTLEVAYVAAVASVLYERYTGRYGLGLDTAPGLLRWHYRELQRQAIAELDYRTQSSPEERTSKKKTEAAKADWAKADELLKVGTGHFFSKAFIEQAVESALEPDLDVDFDHLPKLPDEQTPVRWLSDAALMRQFMQWVDAETDPNSFAWQDGQAILRQLRAMFARAKGQKTDDEVIIPKEPTENSFL